MSHNEIKKVSSHMVVNNVAARVGNATIDLWFLGDEATAVDKSRFLINWETKMVNDPRHLIGFRVNTFGTLVKLTTIAPAFKHDTPSDSPVYPELTVALSKGVSEIIALHGKTEVFTEVPVIDGITEQVRTIFRALRANHYRLVDTHLNGFDIVPGVCENLSELEKFIINKNKVPTRHWCCREISMQGNVPRWGITINPYHVQAVSVEKDTYPTVMEAILVGIEQASATENKNEGSVVMRATNTVCSSLGISVQSVVNLFNILRLAELKPVRTSNGIELVQGYINNTLDMAKLFSCWKNEGPGYWGYFPGKIPKVVFFREEDQTDDDLIRFPDVIAAILYAVSSSERKHYIHQILDGGSPIDRPSTSPNRLYSDLEVRTLIGMARPDLNTIEGKEEIDKLLAAI